MEIRHQDITVTCSQCAHTASDDEGNFDIVVPLQDVKSGVTGPARMRCTVSPERHRVDLMDWEHPNHQSSTLDRDLEQRTSALLDLIAKEKICGHRNICPQTIVAFVEKHGSQNKKGE